MSYLVNDPTEFTDEVIEGFTAANAQLVRRVPGGVARRSATPEGHVAVVIGGGSGHYPAFAGLVGPGLAHGAAMGNVFASPSAHQVQTVAKAVESGGGVLLTYGNYAGDVLNFDQAQDRLREDGVPCRTVAVTDDIFSASNSEREKRRGIAGDLAVFRTAAWAAEQGRTLDEVHDIAARANERTRSFGVAFSGTTLPGADEPLFSVPEGKMAVGMGIHGEPGIEEQDLPTAKELAHLFVGRLLANRPADIDSAQGARVAVILNGLGSVKSEELFVVYGTVAQLLDEAGVTIVDPEVGEFATSFEMAGVSLTLFWLDEELETAWTSPAYGPAYRKGAVEIDHSDAEELPDVSEEEILPDADDASRELAPTIVEVVGTIRRTIDENVDDLGRLDSVAGDGDHGIGMQRGATAAAEAARRFADKGAGAGSVLALAGDAWADRAGGTSGSLWGTALRTLGERLGDTGRPGAADVAEGVGAARDAIMRAGGAEVGDKTLVDALMPFANTLHERVGAGDDLPTAWRTAAEAATDAAEKTADLTASKGRARTHLEKSRGHADPGAVSLAMIVTAVGSVLGGSSKNDKEGASE